MDAWRSFVEAFDRGRWFEAHEILESRWVTDRTGDRDFFQGMIQVAVALHHHASGNPAGAEGLARSARRRLDRYRPSHHGVDVDRLLRDLHETIRSGAPPPSIGGGLRESTP